MRKNKAACTVTKQIVRDIVQFCYIQVEETFCQVHLSAFLFDV